MKGKAEKQQQGQQISACVGARTRVFSPLMSTQLRRRLDSPARVPQSLGSHVVLLHCVTANLQYTHVDAGAFMCVFLQGAFLAQPFASMSFIAVKHQAIKPLALLSVTRTKSEQNIP